MVPSCLLRRSNLSLEHGRSGPRDAMDHKDEFAAFVQAAVGFAFLGEGKGTSDFVYGHRFT